MKSHLIKSTATSEELQAFSEMTTEQKALKVMDWLEEAYEEVELLEANNQPYYELDFND